MATKISDLTSVSSLDGSELIEVVQSGANKKSPISKINETQVLTVTNQTPSGSEFVRLNLLKSGNVYSLNIFWYGALPTLATTTVANLPSGSYPRSNMREIIQATDAAGSLSDRGHMVVAVNADGNIQFAPLADWNNSGNSLIGCVITWVK